MRVGMIPLIPLQEVYDAKYEQITSKITVKKPGYEKYNQKLIQLVTNQIQQYGIDCNCFAIWLVRMYRPSKVGKEIPISVPKKYYVDIVNDPLNRDGIDITLLPGYRLEKDPNKNRLQLVCYNQEVKLFDSFRSVMRFLNNSESKYIYDQPQPITIQRSMHSERYYAGSIMGFYESRYSQRLRWIDESWETRELNYLKHVQAQLSNAQRFNFNNLNPITVDLAYCTALIQKQLDILPRLKPDSEPVTEKINSHFKLRKLFRGFFGRDD